MAEHGMRYALIVDIKNKIMVHLRILAAIKRIALVTGLRQHF